jgi:hypothetical protein
MFHTNFLKVILVIPTYHLSCLFGSIDPYIIKNYQIKKGIQRQHLVNDCRICCCGRHSFHLHLEAGSVKAVADAVVVTAVTETAEQSVKMGRDYVVVHLLCSFH